MSCQNENDCGAGLGSRDDINGTKTSAWLTIKRDALPRIEDACPGLNFKRGEGEGEHQNLSKPT